MTGPTQRNQLQLRSLIRRTGELELSLAEVPIQQPGPGEVLVRIEAAPLNPSDHGLLFGAADMSAAVASGTRERPIVTAPVPPSAMKGMAARWDQSLPAGNEGAGVVVETDASEAARALKGKKVAMMGGGMYSQFRTIAGEILRSMEVAASNSVKTYSRYGSTVYKQVYLYGGLDPQPTELVRDYGMAWGIGGWLVMNFLQKAGPVIVAKLKERIARELRTTFLSRYSREISLAEVLRLDIIAGYRKRETGQKYLVNPNKA